MKNALITGLLASILVMFISVAGNTPVFGADKIMETPIKEVSIQKDKNGNEYVRFIVKEQAELGGITYEKETAVTGFGENLVTIAYQYKPGDTLKAIVTGSEYQGCTYYNILQFIE